MKGTTMRHFNWTAATPRAWSWASFAVDHTASSNSPIVVGQTVWIITDDGQVKKGRVIREAPAERAVRPRASSPSSGE